ncbi:DNA-3-methyladenine glycosylase I [Enterococcus pseudoavium]|uniref:DNA-3-methyladenine glycosylase I n=1 Tax=Enterococcus pseudoavium TaxID=44007 RepID=A0ABU3FFL0_9ENTE|nr:DNA-3-methyladenine glycosylase I [Enterococcus pseudoavium]MDT2755232.1 DNA-3-methyladenine glycosylase I [Enterococcus pseudoavium]MDT2769818.1 DNA-3-methyladenine glycosylase I [Enterococcus pseudoavium]
MQRCQWAGSRENMQMYHDTVWGVPEFDDQRLFRKLVLDMNQAGLSWQTILNKMDNFDRAYEQFELEKVAAFDEAKVESLMQDAGIIRNRRKIEAAINNAQKILAMQAAGLSFSDYLWGFTDHQVIDHQIQTAAEIPTKTELSDAIAKDLKKRGFKFVGSTTIYAFLQAVGIVNDHENKCFRYAELTKKKTI